MKKKIIISFVLILILARIFYPRTLYGYGELESLYIEYYENGYKKIEIENEKEKKAMFNKIKYAWLTSLDLFYTGDECGTDGPSICLVYKNGSYEYFDHSRTGNGYCKYMYLNGSSVANGQMRIDSICLNSAVEEYIKKGEIIKNSS